MPGEIPVLGSFGITGVHNRAKVRGPGVTIGRSGASIGVATYTEHDYWPLNTTLYVKDFRGNDPRFIYYLLRSIDFRAYNSGSAQPSLNRNYIAHIPVTLPTNDEQRAIAEALGALDDKIDANVRKARLLDMYVQAQYVDSSATATRTVLLRDLVELGLGGVWGEDSPTSDKDVLARCLRGVDLASLLDGQVADPPSRWLRTKPFAQREFSEGEIWVEGSGSFCGRSLLVGPHISQLYSAPVRNSNFVKRLLPKVSIETSSWAWLSMRKAYADGEFNQWRTGSAFPNLDISGLLNGHAVPIPSPEVLRRIVQLVQLRLDPALVIESRALVRLRDALLPPLLSGELRVRDIEPLVGEAV